MGRPMRNGNAYVAGWTAGLGDDSGRLRVREREGGRPDRGASASFALGLVHAKRLRHLRTVRSLTPNTFATSIAATPSDNIRSAWARSTATSASSMHCDRRSELARTDRTCVDRAASERA